MPVRVQAATEKLTAVEADLVVTDLRRGDGAAPDLVDVAQSVDPQPPVLLITKTDDQRSINDALDTGYAGFINKSEGFG